MTRTIPFSQYGNLTVMLKVTNGVRPERPTDAEVLGLTDAVWGLMEACWNQQWNERPAVSIVLSRLNEASRYWNLPSPTTVSIHIESHDSDPDVPSLISGVSGFISKSWRLLNVLFIIRPFLDKNAIREHRSVHVPSRPSISTSIRSTTG
jgi:hypothetical protein